MLSEGAEPRTVERGYKRAVTRRKRRLAEKVQKGQNGLTAPHPQCPRRRSGRAPGPDRSRRSRRSRCPNAAAGPGTGARHRSARSAARRRRAGWRRRRRGWGRPALKREAPAGMAESAAKRPTPAALGAGGAGGEPQPVSARRTAPALVDRRRGRGGCVSAEGQRAFKERAPAAVGVGSRSAILRRRPAGARDRALEPRGGARVGGEAGGEPDQTGPNALGAGRPFAPR